MVICFPEICGLPYPLPGAGEMITEFCIQIESSEYTEAEGLSNFKCLDLNELDRFALCKLTSFISRSR